MSTTAATAWTTLSSEPMLLSLRVPVGWGLGEQAENHFRLYGDRSEHADHRPTFAVRMGRPEEPGRAWFDSFRAQAPKQLAATLPGFELLGTDAFELSSPAIVATVHFRQRPQEGMATSQLQAYVWAGSTRMYVVDASTLLADESRDIPVFDAMVGSIRILPPRP